MTDTTGPSPAVTGRIGAVRIAIGFLQGVVLWALTEAGDDAGPVRRTGDDRDVRAFRAARRADAAAAADPGDLGGVRRRRAGRARPARHGAARRSGGEPLDF